MSEFTQAFELHNMVPGKAGRAIVQIMYNSEDGVVECYGTTVPTDANVFAPGCVFHKVNGTDRKVLYVNVGTKALPDFEQVSVSSPYGTAAGRGPSPLIWSDCPVAEYDGNPEAGMHFFDDLLDGIDAATNQSAAAGAALGTTGNFGVFTGTTDNTIVSDATYSQGAAILSCDTDNQSAMVVWPKGATVAGKVKFVAGKKLWLECRVKVSTVADSIGQLFIGLAEEALNSEGALLTINEGGLADKDYIGFVREYADGDALNTDYNEEGGTAISNSNAVTLVADTYIKLGIYSDGTTVTYYADGVALADTALIAATDFPDGEELAFYMQNMCGAAGTVGTATLDWLRIAQEY